jgi:hippurate hydrolase
MMRDLDEIVGWRRSLHAIPEFGFDLTKTSAFVAARLAAMPGMAVTTGIGRTGLVGVLEGKGRGPDRTIALRADMDALKIREATGLPYASTHDGFMHACGHDGHTATLLGAARELSLHPDFGGRVVFLFQPAEEHGQGARAMIADGVIERLRIDEVYGVHNRPGLPVGRFATRVGPVMACEDNFTFEIVGVGGHAARPHTVKDPLVAGAHLVLALQTIVARRLDPLEEGVVSVTEFRTDGTRNVIPQRVVVDGDARSYRPHVQAMIEREMRAQADGLAAMFGVACALDYAKVFAATVNHEAETAHAAAAAAAAFGADAVDVNAAPMMGSEDFGLFLEHRPGNFSYLGNGVEGAHAMPLHNPGYDFNDAALAPGVRYWTELVRRRLAP